MNSDVVPKFLFCCLLTAGYVAPANAQFKLQESFEDTSAPGWTISGDAFLTAPSIDAAGSGWLRLTGTGLLQLGLALNSGFNFASNQPVVVRFNYVSWGGTGADGMTVFLYDSSTPSPMANATAGGGLGYCGGAGGYLAIGLDEFGNFSRPGDTCPVAGGGAPNINNSNGKTPESLVIRGPESSSNAWISATAVAGGIDDPNAVSRPSPKTVQLTLTPAVGPAIGYTITAQFQSASGQAFQTLFTNAAFAYAPPAALSVGFSGSTGGSTNNHELHGLIAATPDDLQVTMSGPASIYTGSSVTYAVTVTNNGNYLLDSGNAPTVADTLPASITGATWTCVGAGGATCDASGTGNISTTNVSLPANGSVTYTITGTLDPTTACGSTVANTADADFSSSTSFLDPDETNNTATVASTVICDSTLANPNPAALVYAPQQLSVPSTSQAVTVTEGSLGSAAIISIAVTGDYSQTNNCPATLAIAQTCTVNVVFTPSAVGSRNGTLTIQSNLAALPTITSVVPLTGTGVNSIPSPFSFTPLINVDPASVQISNFITVASTDVPAPISVSNGGQYSINGGAFTSIPGVVSPGAQVQVKLTAASGYSTSDAAVLTIGGVASTFTVTTGSQTVLQGGFTPVTNAVPASIQTSNAITVAGTSTSVPISVSSGDEYSINGGPFTSAPGTVQPGDQVTAQMTAPATYNTTASAVVTIGGVTSTYIVTTAAAQTPQATFTAVTGAGVSSNQISNAISVTIIAVPASISISIGAAYSINGGPFTTAAGTVRPGDQVRVEAAAASTYSTNATAVLDIDGVDIKYSVTTGPQPLQNVATTGGGGAMGTVTLLMLALLATLRAAGARRSARLVCLAVAFLGAISSDPARADDADWLSNFYGGIRVGESTTSMTAGKLARDLRADGFQITDAGAERGTFGAGLYLGYELPNHFAVEIAGTYIGRTRAALEGVLPSELGPLLADTAHIVRGSGDIVALEARYRLPLTQGIDLDLRAGPYFWLTTADVYVSGIDKLNRSDNGLGYTLGVGPRFALGQHVGIGVSAEYFNSTSQNQFWQFSATLEYHFR